MFYDEVPKSAPPSEALGFSANSDALNEAGERLKKARKIIEDRNLDIKKGQGEGEGTVLGIADRINKGKKRGDDIDTNYIQYQ